MAEEVIESDASARVLVIIPGSVNHFYNLLGRRVASALAELGIRADISTLRECDRPNFPRYDWCLLGNLFEILVAHQNNPDGIARVRHILAGCRHGGAGMALDNVRTHWYGVLHDFHLQVGARFTLDLGLADQAAALRGPHRSIYRFLFNGLTADEANQARIMQSQSDPRPIPWAFLGHGTTHRFGLVDHIMQTVAPNGFVYIPPLMAYTENGPHLNQQQMEAVLRRTQYQIWCSSHDHFYLEPERFRTSLLTGSVPVKVMEDYQEIPENLPHRPFLIPRGELGSRLTPEVYWRMRESFTRECLAQPRLSEGFAKILNELGIPLQRPIPLAKAA
jgi:hypothetical protein